MFNVPPPQMTYIIDALSSESCTFKINLHVKSNFLMHSFQVKLIGSNNNCAVVNYIKSLQDVIQWNTFESSEPLSEFFLREFVDFLDLSVWEDVKYRHDLSNEFKIEMQMKGYL